jgi:4-hydroxy-3-polyprenylbenzoate decarboxylase
MSERDPIVVAITGASGAPYAVRLLESLVRAEQRVWLTISSHGWRLLQMESGVGSLAELQERAGGRDFDDFVTLYDSEDRGASPASGSARTRGMIICPCSMGTLAAVAAGTSRSLVERAADVTLKERRALIMVIRETPLSAIHLENMLRLTRAGAVVLPAAPGFYNSPRGIPDLVDFIVARVLDHVDVEHSLSRRWGAEPHGEG